MQATYKFTLLFPFAESYSVDDILDFISVIQYPCLHHLDSRPAPTALVHPDSKNITILPTKWNISPTSHQVASISMENAAYHRDTSPVCNACKQARILAKQYLAKRLHEAVTSNMFEIWYLPRKQVIPPPQLVATAEGSKSGPPFLSDDPRLRSSSLDGWILGASLYRNDLETFCTCEKLEFAFEPTKTQQAEPSSFKHAANYRQLANAFKVKFNEDENLKWFRQRCSDHKKYKEFSNALITPGKPGKKDAPATFNILLIADFLCKKGLLTLYRLRKAVEKEFPYLIDEFELNFGGNSDL